MFFSRIGRRPRAVPRTSVEERWGRGEWGRGNKMDHSGKLASTGRDTIRPVRAKLVEIGPLGRCELYWMGLVWRGMVSYAILLKFNAELNKLCIGRMIY